MKTEIEQAIAAVCNTLFGVTPEVIVTRPDEQFGDFATNIALQLGKQLDRNPREVAEQVASEVQKQSSHIKQASVAGPGFINLVLTDEALQLMQKAQPAQTQAGKTIVVEYSDPNPFKILHAGHLYTSVVGDAIANLLERAGASVHRVNFGGDVGLHVGKTMWAILKDFGGEHPEKLQSIEPAKRSEWMSERYVAGTAAYEDDEKAKSEIVALNKKIYQIHSSHDKESPLAQIYWTCRQWSYASFDEFYSHIGSSFDRYYPESETAPIGLKTVQEHTGSVFVESDGAVVFRGEDHDLHTRVFINSEGLPTYEAKDVGLIIKKWEDYHFDRSVVITGNDIVQYMAVVLKAIEQFAPELARATTHLTHGMVKLAGGKKMSSRKGNILRATDVLDEVKAATIEQHQTETDDTALGAVKYAFLKQRLGGDIIFDIEESVAMEGNSGPYLQYAHARARSILTKSTTSSDQIANNLQFDKDERSLLRKIGEYTEVVDKSVAELMPHHICTYLYELAQAFNRFYEHNRVVNDPREAIRLKLVKSYADVLKSGLELLNIPAPEKM